MSGPGAAKQARRDEVAENVHDKLKGDVRKCSKCGKPLIFVSEWQRGQNAQYCLGSNGRFGETNFPDEADDIVVTRIHDDCGKPLSDKDDEWFLNKLDR